MTQETPLEEFATVRLWLQAYASHWNRTAAEAEQRQKLGLLHRYCELAERDPDALVSNLLRETPTGKKIWLKRRRAEMARIEEFEAIVAGGEPRAGRDAGNVIRSFFIHNGVALTATPFR
jgi:hypothetical protein